MPTSLPNLMRYPASTDTPNVPRDLQRLAEDAELAIVGSKLPWFGKPYVESGGALTAGTGLGLNIAAGIACINGWRFAFTAQANLAMNASTTNHLWLQQLLDGNGRHSSYQWVVNTTTAVPANAVYVGQLVTGAAGFTTLDASFRGVIAPGGLVGVQTRTTVLGATALNNTSVQVIATALDILGDGVTKYDLDGYIPSVLTSAAGSGINTLIVDSVLGEIADSWYGPSAVNGRHSPTPERQGLGPWVGKRSFTMSTFSSAATNVSADTIVANKPAFLRGRFSL